MEIIELEGAPGLVSCAKPAAGAGLCFQDLLLIWVKSVLWLDGDRFPSGSESNRAGVREPRGPCSWCLLANVPSVRSWEGNDGTGVVQPV